MITNDTLYATSTLETWRKITRSKIFENYLITKRQTEKSINRRTKALPWSNYGRLHSYGEHGVKYLVVRRPISAKPRLNFNLGFFIPLFKCLFGIIRLNFLLKLSGLKSDFTLALGYPNPALNNPAQVS